MKNIKGKILTAVIATAMLAASASGMLINVGAAVANNIVITIDPGHGGQDPGNTKAAELYGDGKTEHYESRHVYDISMYVKERLMQYAGVTVHLTRDDLSSTTSTPSLESRPNLASYYNSDAFVSIHTNSFNTTAHGTEIHVPTKAVNFNNTIAVESHKAAQTVLSSMISELGIYSRGLKYDQTSSSTYSTGEDADYLRVIRQGRKNGIPVIMLIETAFADNENDFNNYLSTTEQRKQMGYAIADGLATYYGLSLLVDTDTPFYAQVQKINNRIYGSLTASLDDGAVTLDAEERGIKIDGQSLTVNGWMGVDGGIKEYLYSVNCGDYEAISGGTDGEPSNGFYSSLGLSNASKMGMFSSDNDGLTVDLSYYEGQTISVTLAARVLGTDEIIPFLLLSNYTVPIYIPENLSATYGQKLSDINLPEKLKWSSPSSSVGNAGNTFHSATFTATDGTTKTVSIKIKVNKAVPSYSSPEPTEGQFMDKLSSISLPAGWSWADEDTVLDTLGNQSFDIIYTPADSNNYSTIHATLTVEVKCSKHIYENDCDTTCECGDIRDITHTYKDGCDTDCDICGEVRDVPHIYSNSLDRKCDRCGEVKTAYGCASDISGTLAVIASLSIGFIIIKKKSNHE